MSNVKGILQNILTMCKQAVREWENTTQDILDEDEFEEKYGGNADYNEYFDGIFDPLWSLVEQIIETLEEIR
jgi:hypothetical protein